MSKIIVEDRTKDEAPNLLIQFCTSIFMFVRQYGPQFKLDQKDMLTALGMATYLCEICFVHAGEVDVDELNSIKERASSLIKDALDDVESNIFLKDSDKESIKPLVEIYEKIKENK